MRRAQQARARRSQHYKGAAFERVIAKACERFGVSRSRLLYGSRSQDAVQARIWACQEMRKLNPMPSYPRIGKALNLHHTTVLAHCKRDRTPGPASMAEVDTAHEGEWI
jgi:chromosomal replication initiation ATPase DnaA